MKSMDDFTEIKQLEIELADPETRKDVDRLDLLISEDFEEFGSSGKSYKKKDILKILPNSDTVEYEMSDFRFKTLSEDSVLVKYKYASPKIGTFRSSIWIRVSGKWQLLHHQSTVIPLAT